jgi:hypothetical protein
MEGMPSFGFPMVQHQIAGLKTRKPTPQAKAPISLVALWILDLLESHKSATGSATN